MTSNKKPPGNIKSPARSGGNEVHTTLTIPNTSWSPERPAATDHVERLGDLLRRAREKRGDELQRIADTLCIKASLLTALENSEYDAFTADAYVIGFLRSYANYLGIDGREAIDRYRFEMAGRRKKPVLFMPTPVPEGRAPSALLVGGALLSALFVYALWYSIFASDKASETMPILPPSLVASNSPSLKSEPIPPPSPVTINQPISAPQEITAAPTVTPTAAPVTVKNSAAPTPKTEVLSVAPPPVTHSTSNINNNILPLSPNARSKPAGMASLDNLPPLQPLTASKVTVKALSSTWVLITDEHGNTLVNRVMKSGEIYHVPDGKGASLTTGNGAGLLFTVDGVNLPRINGPYDSAHLMHNLALDPSSLKAKASGAEE